METWNFFSLYDPYNHFASETVGGVGYARGVERWCMNAGAGEN